MITFPELSVECLVDLVDSGQETFRIPLFSASDSEFAFQINSFQKYAVIINFPKLCLPMQVRFSIRLSPNVILQFVFGRLHF